MFFLAFARHSFPLMGGGGVFLFVEGRCIGSFWISTGVHSWGVFGGDRLGRLVSGCRVFVVDSVMNIRFWNVVRRDLLFNFLFWVGWGLR